MLAYQIGGDAGLQLLHANGKAEERESAPAENLMVELLALPGKENLSTLLLIDEVLMYARGKIGIDPSWRGKLIDFFQYLTQAATKVDRCAVVASLLATDPSKSDTLGKELTNELYAIFRRQKEEGVQPVQKEDVAEVLRRRFFTPDSIRDREAFRSHVVAALKGISALDEQTAKEGKNAEDRFVKSFPFHPDLTEIFYTKWTNLESFQRTRGILRTFALALRDAEKWDQSPLVSTNAFLSLADADSISEAARELTGVATSEEYEGKKQEWSAILQWELNKAENEDPTNPIRGSGTVRQNRQFSPHSCIRNPSARKLCYGKSTVWSGTLGRTRSNWRRPSGAGPRFRGSLTKGGLQTPNSAATEEALPRPGGWARGQTSNT